MHRLCLAMLATASLIAGCGAGDRPETGEVTGKVMRGATPVVGARVYFTPVDGGRTSEATTQGDGSYELVYLRDIKGAKIGEHKVRITTFDPPEVTDDGKKVGGRPEEIPSQYSGGEERRTVKAGAQVIDFAL